MKYPLRVVLAGVVVLGSLVGCAAEQAEPAAIVSEAPSASSTPQTSSTALLELMSGVNYDFNPIDGTRELAALSEIVLRGEVTEVLDGPQVGNPDDALRDIPLVVVRVGALEVVQGELAPESDGYLYLSIVAPAGAKLVSQAIPNGTPVVVYGNRIVNEKSDGDIPVINSEKGRPAGQPIYRATGAQGLVFEVTGESGPELIWPGTQYSTRGDLKETLPGGSLDGFDESTNH